MVTQVNGVDPEKGAAIRPIPHEPEATQYFEAGAITIGVEYRYLDQATALMSFRKNEEEGLELGFDPDTDVTIDDDEGVAIHVFATEDLGEWMRFDCFDDEPHYHYVDPVTPWVNRFSYDPVANGEMIDWVFDVMAKRMPTLIERAGSPTLAAQIDTKVLAGVLPKVRTAANAAVAEARARRAAKV